VAGARRLKVDGFRQHWHARLIEQRVEPQDESYLFHIELQAPRRLWDRAGGQARRVTVELRLGKRQGFALLRATSPRFPAASGS
jgi:hypothetical protein